MKNRLTERDITRIVRRVVNEEEENPMPTPMDEGKRINLELKQELESPLDILDKPEGKKPEKKSSKKEG